MNKGKDKTSIEQDIGRLNQDSQSFGSELHKVQRAVTSLGGTSPNQTAVENLTKIIKSAHEKRYAKLNSEKNSSYHDHNAEKKDGLTDPPSAGTNSAYTCDHEYRDAGDPHLTLCDNPDHIPFDSAMPVGTDEIGNEEFESGLPRKRIRGPFHRREKSLKSKASEVTIPPRSPVGRSRKSSEPTFGGSPSERDTTGTPFLRVPDRLRRSHSKSSNRKRRTSQTDGAESPYEEEIAEDYQPHDPASQEPKVDIPGDPMRISQDLRYSRLQEKKAASLLVPVGVSRLHMVEMPALTVGTAPNLQSIALTQGRWAQFIGILYMMCTFPCIVFL